MKLEPGPELDAKVCDVLGIAPDEFGDVVTYERVSTDPGEVVTLLEAIHKIVDIDCHVGRCNNFGRPDGQWVAQFWDVDKSTGTGHRFYHAATPNLALCKLALALKLAEEK